MLSRPRPSAISRRRLLLLSGGSAVTALLSVACAGAPPTPRPAPTATLAAKPVTTPAVAQPTATPAAAAKAASAAPSAKQPVKLRWGLLYAPLEPQAKAIIEDYTKTKPSVTVSIEVLPSGAEFRPKILTLLAANDLPDIVEAGARLLIDLAARNVMIDLGPSMASDPIVNDKYFDDFFLKIGQHQGKTIALPQSADVQLVLYNKKMFDDSKVPYPKDDWKYEDFLEAARKLTQKDSAGKTTRWGYVADYYFFSMNHMIGECATPLLNGGKKVSWTTPEALRSLHRQIDPVKEGVFLPPEVLGTVGGVANAFIQGKAAMSYAVRINVPAVRGQLKDDWDAVEVPTGTCRKSPVMGTIGRSISTSAKDREAAWDFHRYYYLADGGMKHLIPTYAITPPIPKLFQDPTWKSLAPPPANHRAFENSLKNGTTPQLEIDFSKAAQIDRILTDLFLASSSGRQSVEDAAKEAEAKANTLLAQ